MHDNLVLDKEIGRPDNSLDSFAKETQRTIIAAKKINFIIVSNHQDNTKH
jgi:hypothetical protein